MSYAALNYLYVWLFLLRGSGSALLETGNKSQPSDGLLQGLKGATTAAVSLSTNNGGTVLLNCVKKNKNLALSNSFKFHEHFLTQKKSSQNLELHCLWGRTVCTTFNVYIAVLSRRIVELKGNIQASCRSSVLRSSH